MKIHAILMLLAATLELSVSFQCNRLPFLSAGIRKNSNNKNSMKAASSAELLEQARLLREEANELESERKVESPATAGKTYLDIENEYKAHYSIDIPVLKAEGETEESVFFKPTFANLQSGGDQFDITSDLIRVDLPLPLGIVLGQEKYSDTVTVDEISGENAVAMEKLKVGDVLRCTSSCTTQMTTPTWQLLVGGIGQPQTVRFMYNCDGRKSKFEEVLNAVTRYVRARSDSFFSLLPHFIDTCFGRGTRTQQQNGSGGTQCGNGIRKEAQQRRRRPRRRRSVRKVSF